MASFSKGTSFTDGVTGDVTAAKLHALVDAATPVPGFITDRTAETSIATDDLVLISDTSDSGALNKMTVANFTNIVSTGTGTAADPAIRPTGDTNTGIFFPAADTIAFSEGGAEAMRIDSSGNVGIGTTPSNKLHLYSGSQAVSATQLELEAFWGGYGAGVNFSSRTSSGGTLVSMAKITADGENSWNTTATTQDAGLRFFTASDGSLAERLRIDSSGIILSNGASNTYGGTGSLSLNAPAGSAVDLELRVGNSLAGYVYCDSGNMQIVNQNSGFLGLYTNATERLRITSGGEVLVGKTQTNGTVVGVFINTNGRGLFTSDADAPLFANRLTNDGTLVEFQQANILEGTISVSGTTVSYNGGHLSRYSQLPSGQRDLSIKKGTVLSNLDEMCVWNDAEGNPLPNEQLNKVRISDVEGDSNVAGVFVNWDNDDQDNPFDMNMAMTGDMIIRIAQGVTVSRGDLLMSAGDGTAKPQGDDIRKAKTIAKVTSANVSCTYEDGSYCVPCVLMAC